MTVLVKRTPRFPSALSDMTQKDTTHEHLGSSRAGGGPPGSASEYAAVGICRNWPVSAEMHLSFTLYKSGHKEHFRRK